MRYHRFLSFFLTFFAFVFTAFFFFTPLTFASVTDSYIELSLGGTPDFYTGGMAYDINNSGYVVGHAKTSLGEEHAFWYKDGQMIDIHPSGFPRSAAISINEQNQILINTLYDSFETNHTFLYKNGEYISLDGIGEKSGIFVNDINDNGVIVGSFSYLPDDTERHVFKYKEGLLSDLGNYGTGNIAINNNEDVVWNNGEFGVLYQNGQITNLGDVNPYSINNHGEIVGNFRVGSNAHAFIFKNVQLTDIHPSGWVSSGAIDINEKGQIVGFIANNTYHGAAGFYENGVWSRLSSIDNRWNSARAINENNQIAGVIFRWHATLWNIQYNNNPPLISITSPVGTVSAQSVAITVNLTDDTGIASQTRSVDGTPIANNLTALDLTYYAPGQHTFTITATDTEGLSASQSSTFFYSPTATSIIDNIETMTTNGDITQITNSLISKLENAQSAIEAGNYNQARNKLEALLNQIQAQIDIHITAYAGNLLISQIQYLINTLP